MEIKKYGICMTYGYGFLKPSSGSEKYAFINEIVIYSDNISETVELMPMHVSLYKGAEDSYGNPSSSKQPLLVVYDGINWYEYFTANYVSIILSNSLYLLRNPSYDADNYSHDGFREFSIVEDDIFIVDPRIFEGYIQNYTEDDIKNMALQINTLIHNAKSWVDDFDRARTNVIDKRRKLDYASKCHLESNVGKYANIDTESKHINNQIVAQPSGDTPSPGNTGCFGAILMILLPPFAMLVAVVSWIIL